MPPKAASKSSTPKAGPGEQLLVSLARPSVMIAATLAMLVGFVIVSFSKHPDGGTQMGLVVLASVFTVCATWLRRP